MTAADNMDELDEALEQLRDLVKRRDCQRAVVHVVADGRVYIELSDSNGYVQALVEADLEDGGALPLPSAALERLEQEGS